jgi:hypothetical protein
MDTVQGASDETDDAAATTGVALALRKGMTRWARMKV